MTDGNKRTNLLKKNYRWKFQVGLNVYDILYQRAGKWVKKEL